MVVPTSASYPGHVIWYEAMATFIPLRERPGNVASKKRPGYKIAFI